VQTYDGFHGAAAVALLGGALVAAAGAAFAALRWVQRVPRLPHAGPATSELGPEPPAVVDLLVSGWHVTSEAVPATLVDLAARRFVDLDEVGPERFVVRVRPEADRAQVTAYEAQVLHRVEERATGGSAPVEVLRLDAGERDRWLSEFSGAVVRDAEERGLASRGWTRGEAVVLAVGLAIALALFALAFELAHVGAHRNAHGANTHTGAWFAVAAVVWLFLVTSGVRLRTIRATPAGRAACSRWLGVRAYLRANASFVEQPAAAVAVWGRLLAYGVALGANRASVGALAIGPDDPRHAWSRVGGTWRRVRVRRPRRFGAGKAPRPVLVGGLARLVLWGAVGVVVVPVLVDVAWHAFHEATGGDGNLLVSAVLALFVVALTAGAAYVVVRVVDGAVRVWRAVWDLGHTSALEGTVVQVQDGSFAVDDGSSDEVVALRADDGRVPRLGERVSVRFTPKLHHVRDVAVVADRSRHVTTNEEATDGVVQAASADTDRQPGGGRAP